MGRPGDLRIGIQRLKKAMSDLQHQWAMTTEQWNDQTAKDFEKNHLEAMLPALRLVMAETSELEAAYREAIEACRDTNSFYDEAT